MNINQLPGKWRCTLLQQSPIWGRPVDSISHLDLRIFLRQHWGTQSYNHALAEVGDLISVVWDAMLAGAIEGAPKIIYFEPPSPRLTVDELIAWLSNASIERRRAILFALEAKRSIKETVELCHDDLRSMKLSPLASDIVRSMVRNLHLDYVFWERSALTGKPMPLIGLADSVTDVSQGIGFDALRRLYDDLLVVDRHADLRSFATLVYH